MNSPLVKIQQLAKHYPMQHGIVQALQAVDLKIQKGESLAIMGPSGSGKSTLLHLLGCLDKPSHGHYWLDGKDISELADEELAHIRATKIGFVFQSFNLIPQMNVYDNVATPFLYQKNVLPPEVVHERIVIAIERVGLSKRLYHLPSQLSGGETQRVAIARALAIHPLIILADEPTGNLDSATGATILDLFHTLNIEGATIVMITHDEKVGAHCGRTIRMQDGKMLNS